MRNLKLLISAIVLFLSVNTYGQTIVHKKKVKIQDSLIVSGNIKTTGTLSGTSASFSGNVGIGTDSPSEKLNVDGNILATGTVSASNLSGTNTGDQDLSGLVDLTTAQTVAGIKTFTSNVVIKNGDPTLGFADTDSNADDFFIHVNSNNFYVLSDRDDSGGNNGITGWDGAFPLQLESDTNKAYTFGNEIWHAGNLTISGTNTGNQDLSPYLTSAIAATTFLPLAGGTMTGNIRFDSSPPQAVFITQDADGGGSGRLLSIGKNSKPWGSIAFFAEEEQAGFLFFTMGSSTNEVAQIDASGGATFNSVKSKNNNVQTITGSTSSATIASDKNVVVVDTAVDCTLTIALFFSNFPLASVKIINIGTGNVYFSAGTGVSVNNILDGSLLLPDLSATLTKITANSCIISE